MKEKVLLDDAVDVFFETMAFYLMRGVAMSVSELRKRATESGAGGAKDTGNAMVELDRTLDMGDTVTRFLSKCHGFDEDQEKILHNSLRTAAIGLTELVFGIDSSMCSEKLKIKCERICREAGREALAKIKELEKKEDSL